MKNSTEPEFVRKKSLEPSAPRISSWQTPAPQNSSWQTPQPILPGFDGTKDFVNIAYRIFLSSRLTPRVSPFSSRHSQTHCMYPAYILCTVWLHCMCHYPLSSHSPHTSHPLLWQAGCSPPPHTDRKIRQKRNCRVREIFWFPAVSEKYFDFQPQMVHTRKWLFG